LKTNCFGIDGNSIEKDDIIVVFVRGSSAGGGDLVQVVDVYEGDDDLSYHGSSWYELFIKGKNLETGEVKEYGNQTYSWVHPMSYISNLEKKIRLAKDALK
jgi:hypothetical protein